MFLNAAYALLGVVPMLSLAVIAGGVTFSQILHVSLVLANTMFFSLALGTFISTLSRNERKAMFAASVTILALTGGPFLLAAWWTELGLAGWRGGSGAFPEELIWFSPLYPFLCVQTSPTSWPIKDFYVGSLLLHHAAGWALLVGAFGILPRFINDLPSARFAWIRTALHDYAFGKKEQRRRYRAALLDRNAFLWLASRERVKPFYAWAIVLFFALLYLWVYFQFPNLIFDLQVSLVIILLVHVSLKIWASSEVASRLLEDRRSGALELLLCTPLSVREIARGQSLALRRIFGQAVTVLILAELFLATASVRSGFQNPGPTERALTFLALGSTLLLDLWAIKWLGQWLCLFGKSMERVLIATLARLLAVPWLIYMLLFGLLAAISSLQGLQVSYRVHLLTWWSISLLVSLGFGLHARASFLSHFREAASSRFDGQPGEDPPSIQPKHVEPLPATAILIFRRYLRRHWVASSFALIVLVMTGLGAARHLYYRVSLEREIQRVRAEALPVSLRDLNSYIPPVPSEENAATLLLRTGSTMGAPMNQWQQLARTRKGWLYDDDRAMVKNVVRANSAQVKAIRLLPKFGTYQTEMSDMQMQRAASIDLQGYIALSCIHTLDGMDQNDAAKVEESLLGMVALARLLRHNPNTTSQFFAWMAVEQLSRVLEAVLARRILDGGRLARLQAALDTVDDDTVLPRQLAVMRAMLLDKQFTPFMFMMGPRQLTINLLAHGVLRGVGFDRQLLLDASQRIRGAMERSSLPYPARLEQVQLLEAEAQTRPGLLRGTFAFFAGNLAHTFKQHATITARIAVLRTAVATARHDVENQRKSRSLDELVPRYLDSVPTDPFSGGTIIRKRISRNAIIFYSVGTDQRDDSGPLTNATAAMGDIAFTYEF